MAIRKGSKPQLGLFFLLEACQRNAAGLSTAVSPANAKLPIPHRRSPITRPCCSIERSSAKLLVFTCTSKFERSTGSESEHVDALGLRAVEVIICMITRDIQRDINDVTGVSLSLPLTKDTNAQYRKRFRASYNNYYRKRFRASYNNYKTCMSKTQYYDPGSGRTAVNQTLATAQLKQALGAWLAVCDIRLGKDGTRTCCCSWWCSTGCGSLCNAKPTN